jgi:predicted peptidase
MRMMSRKPLATVAVGPVLGLGLMMGAAALTPDAAHGATSGRQQPHSFKAEIRKTVNLNYLLYLPKAYGLDKEKHWPVILFLHGSGERGTDLNKVKTLGPPKLVSEGKEMPFIIVSPQAPEGSNWDPDALTALLDEINNQYAVDQDRVYLTGVSLGGSGTWRLASAHPERFAAIAPICGGGDPSMAPRIGAIPTWVFHGAKDELVPVQASQEMVAALKEAGNDAKLTVYPDAGHDAWTQTYDNPAVFEWLLSHKRPSSSSSASK